MCTAHHFPVIASAAKQSHFVIRYSLFIIGYSLPVIPPKLALPSVLGGPAPTRLGGLPCEIAERYLAILGAFIRVSPWLKVCVVSVFSIKTEHT